jgi:hypothetical protein
MAGMTGVLARPGWLLAFDRIAIGVSGLCVAHCVATTFVIALASTAGGMVFHHSIHEAGLIVAILLGAVALGRGAVEHGMMMPAAMGSVGLGMMAGALQLPHDVGDHAEALWTVVGACLLAFGHRLNRLALD